LKRIMKDF